MLYTVLKIMINMFTVKLLRSRYIRLHYRTALNFNFWSSLKMMEFDLFIGCFIEC